MPSSLSNYDVTFRQNRLIGLWSWTATKNPVGELSSFGMFISKEVAEVDALRAIERYDAAETISGHTLRRRVETRGAAVGEIKTKEN